MEKTQRALSIIKEKQARDELQDYKYLRGKIEKIVGDKDAADDVLREAIIQNINQDAQDGINVFVGEPDCPTMQFNNLPRVEVKRVEPVHENKLDVEIFPGESHKPVITFVKQDNFQWGDVEDIEVPVERELPPTPPPPPPKVKRPKPPPPPPPKPEIIKVPTPLPAPPPQVITKKEYVPYPVPEFIPPPPPVPCPPCPSCPKCPDMPLPPPPPPKETKVVNIDVKQPPPDCPVCPKQEKEIKIDIESSEPPPCPEIKPPEREIKIDVEHPQDAPEKEVRVDIE